MKDSRPIVENAPGLVWRRHKNAWEGLWRARADLVERGYPLKNQRVWFGEQLGERDALKIADACRRLQDEMLVWGRGSVPTVKVAYDKTLGSLINCYQTDPDSTYHKLRYHVRKSHDGLLWRIKERHGHEELAVTETGGVNARWLLGRHKEWSDGGTKVSMGHQFIGKLRTIFAFGATILECGECERLCGVLHKMRFQSGKPRSSFLKFEHVALIIPKAHERGYHSIALAQAFQFELILRQKDVIGEWVPTSEPGLSDVIDRRRQRKWLRGIRWNEIDQDFVIKHVTSKKDKPLEADLKLSSVIMQELARVAGIPVKELRREMLPSSGPLVVAESSSWPWTDSEYRRKWRDIATDCGISKSIKNMDSRSGGLSEADALGIDREHVRKAATHAQLSQTQDYMRDVRTSADAVLSGRAKGRKNDQNG